MVSENLLLVLCGRVLLEGGGQGDVWHHGHGVPLLGLLSRVHRLGGKVGVVRLESGHLGVLFVVPEEESVSLTF